MPGRAGTRPAIEPCRDEQGLDLQRVTCNWPPATTHVDIRQDIEYAGSCRLSRGSSLSDQEAGGANQAGAGLTDSERNVNDRKEPEEAVMLRRLKMKLRALFDKTRMESELDRELRFHLDREIEKNLQGGLRFEEARTVALRSFGGVERVKEETRDVRGLRRVETAWQDLRYGLRVLKKNPGFAAVAILTVALGIGANTAIFSIINAVLLRPLPYDQPGRLMVVMDSLPTVGFPRTGLSQLEYIRLRQESRSFEGLSVATLQGRTLTGGGEAEVLTACIVSSNFFDTFHVKPALGRFFEPEEDLAGKSNVVVLSHGFWQRRFDSSLQAIGQSIT